MCISAARSTLQQDTQHTSQRFGRAPQQLITHGERAEVLRTHIEFAQTTNRYTQGARYSGRAQLADARFALVRHQLDPGVVLADQAFDIRQRHILVQLDGQRLAVAAHGADAHAQAIDRDRVLETTEDLVGFRLALPLFTALAVWQFLVDVRNQAAGQRYAEVVHWEGLAAHGFGHLAVDIQNGAGRISQFIGHGGVDRTHLFDHLAHVLRTSTAGRLIGHGAHPLDQTGFVQAAQGHQHQADGAVAADVVLGAGIQLLINHLAVDRIKHDNRAVIHAQRRGGIDPIALPAGFAQLGEHFAGVVATLAGQNHAQAFHLVNAVGVLQRRRFLANSRALAADIGGGEEHWFDQVEILFFQHTLHQHGTDHAAPTDQTYTFHNHYTYIS